MSQLRKRVHLFNCDNTYKLDSVETLVLKMADDLNLRILVDKRNFRLSEMSDVCENIIPQLQMDYAVLVVHAHESRLSINEDNAGIGYAKIYRALLRATGRLTVNIEMIILIFVLLLLIAAFLR